MNTSIILSNIKTNSKGVNISLFGSILIPSKQFLTRFKYRPWKGVYCSHEFLDSVNVANKLVENLLETYWIKNICPVVETNISTEEQIKSLNILIDS